MAQRLLYVLEEEGSLSFPPLYDCCYFHNIDLIARYQTHYR